MLTEYPYRTTQHIEDVKKQFIALSSKGNVAAFVYEPLVQGAAAMKMHKAEHLNELLKIAKEHRCNYYSR